MPSGCHRYSIGNSTRETDHRTIGALIRTDDTPGAVDLGLHIRRLSPTIPIRIGGSQKRHHRIPIQPSRVVVEVIVAVSDPHNPSFPEPSTA